MTIALNERQTLLINILKDDGGWMTQNNIAHLLGSDILPPEDIMELDRLGDLGLLVKEIVDKAVESGEDVRYRYSQPKVERGKDRA